MNLTIREINRAINGQLILGDPKMVAKNTVVDSRLVEPGSLFFALQGLNQDGHDFVMSAGRQGAVGVVVTRLDWLRTNDPFHATILRVPDTLEAIQLLGRCLRQSFQGPVVGITGSNGKTTTKQMLANILKSLGPGLSTPGNYNSQIGLPLVLSGLKPEDKWMVLEMGATEPGHITSLTDVASPTIGIITNIGPAHLATFGSLKLVAESKWELMDSLPKDGCAVLPWGEVQLQPYIRSFTKRVVFYGEDPACPVRASSIELGEKIRFSLHVGSQMTKVSLPVLGRFNVSNALASAAAAWVLGCSLDQIVTGLQTFEPAKMRMELMPHPSGAILINDAYNANPVSMVQSVQTVIETFPQKKRVLVLGSMLELGDESEKLHFHLGVELGRYPLEQIYLIGGEMTMVQEGAISVGASAQKFLKIKFMEDLAPLLKKFLNPQTVILFKGSRGIQLEKAIPNLKEEVVHVI